ncbi:hypothetical protein [Microbacterium sp. P05]|uniref:hypothetical protein n=1 Tax=Microbacterium sp. P05 TaxID=3366948 RepID=UPI003747772A
MSAMFSVAELLESAVHRTAVAHGLGFWDCSTEGGNVWWPPEQSYAHEEHPHLTLMVESEATATGPSDALIAASVDWLSHGRGPSFVVLEDERGDYLQAAGGAEGLTLEWRRWGKAGVGGEFWHGVAAHDGDESGELVALPGRTRSFPILPNERLSGTEVREALLASANGTSLEDRFVWHDITEQLAKK